MNILEITRPGSWLEGHAPNEEREISKYLGLLESAFFEANASLYLFGKEIQRDFPDISVEDWDRNQEEIIEEERRLIGDDYDDLSSGQLTELTFQARANVKRKKWERGELPDSIISNYILIYAKSFLYSLDKFSLILSRMNSESWAPQSIPTICKDFFDGIPSLRDVRNSFHHQEDRAFGIGGNRKPMAIQPINNGLFGGPHGALIGESLNGRLLGTTIGDGSFVEIEVSEDTLKLAQKAIHDVYNSFQWSGPKEHYPT